MHPEKTSILEQLWHFVLHLRLHYQLFILSGGFLLGGFLSSGLEVGPFLVQFVSVHLLLFGGATAYNSYWDKDEGPIGGLKNPPPMQQWMWSVSLAMQAAGAVIALWEGGWFAGFYLVSMVFFWLYSTPLARWKSHPIKSLVAIGVSTGSNSVFLGYLAAGNREVSLVVVVAALGTALLLLSLYPISQIYQLEEDRKRGDKTFAVRYGKEGVVRFFGMGFVTGLILVGIAIGIFHQLIAMLFGIIGLVIALFVYKRLQSLNHTGDDYDSVMQMKYGTSLGFVGFLIAGIILKHIDIDGISWVANLLLE